MRKKSYGRRGKIQQEGEERGPRVEMVSHVMKVKGGENERLLMVREAFRRGAVWGAQHSQSSSVYILKMI